MRSLIPWNQMELNPLGSLAAAPNDLDRFFGRLLERSPSAGDPLVRIDWSESEDEVTLRAEIPGVPAADLDITVAGDVLTLAGEKKGPTEEEDKTTYSERRYGAFRRQVQLPYAIATDQVRAESVDGVVTIHLPKSEAERARRIEVNPAS